MPIEERQALDLASRTIRHRRYEADKIRTASLDVVRRAAKLVHRSMVLIEAALLAAMSGGSSDTCLTAARTCTVAQLELMWSGWEELLCGFYAAATGKCRLITELSDYIVAVSRSEENAKKVLDRSHEWRAGDARKYIQREMIADQVFGHRWGEAQKELHAEFAAFGHVGNGLLSAVLHQGRDGLYTGHQLDRSMLRPIAAEYVQLAIFASRASAEALSEHLTDAGAWQAAHLELLSEWQPYLDFLEESLGRDQRT